MRWSVGVGCRGEQEAIDPKEFRIIMLSSHVQYVNNKLTVTYLVQEFLQSFPLPLQG